MLYKVDFPDPLGPNNPTISPGYISIEIFFKIGLPSKDLLISFNSKIGLFFLNFIILKPFFIFLNLFLPGYYYSSKSQLIDRQYLSLRYLKKNFHLNFGQQHYRIYLLIFLN